MADVEPLLGVTIDDKKQKPTIKKLYDFTKGGTDMIDQKMGFYSVKTKSRRWTIVSLAYFLDIIRVNACSVYAMNNGLDSKKQNSFDFGFQISKSLVTPQIVRRARNGLTSVVLSEIPLFIRRKK